MALANVLLGAAQRWDVEQDAAPGKPARFSFPATIEGVFEIESHEAEHAGKDALIARLVVEPS